MSITIIKDGGLQSVKDGANTSTQELATHTALPNAHHSMGYKPSDDLLHNNATERTANATSYTKIKETLINVTGKYRITFEHKCTIIAQTLKSKIYKNGVAYGTEKTTSSTTYVEETEDLTFQAGDLLQIYSYITTNSYSVKNLKIKGVAITDFEDTSGY